MDRVLPDVDVGLAGVGVGAALLLGSALSLLIVLSLHVVAPVPLVPEPVEAQEDSFFVNTTATLARSDSHCEPGEPCPLRAAIRRADEVQGTVRACYDPADVSWGLGCPDGALPLKTADPGYDEAQEKWIFTMPTDLISYEILTGTVTIDFAQDIRDWAGPSDNHIVIEALREQNFALAIQADDNVLTGFEVRGSYNVAAIELRVGSSGNQIGPGLIIAGVESGVGIRLRDEQTTGNHILGNWCGISGDGTVVLPVVDDCIAITKGAHTNTVGGVDPSDRNVLSGSSGGAAIRIDDFDGQGTRANVVEGNWIGLDATGTAAVPCETGVLVRDEAHETRITGNVVSGNRGAGISVSGLTFNTTVENNLVGADPDDTLALGNGGFGIAFHGMAKDSYVARNRVVHNKGGGIRVAGGNTRGIEITENSVTANLGPAVAVLNGANSRLQPPQIDVATAKEVVGRACPNCTVEVYSDPAGQADTFEGRVDTDKAFGTFRFVKEDGFRHGSVAVIALDSNKNTSGISEPRYLPGYPTPEPTATTVVPTVTPEPGSDHRLALPWLARNAR